MGTLWPVFMRRVANLLGHGVAVMAHGSTSKLEQAAVKFRKSQSETVALGSSWSQVTDLAWNKTRKTGKLGPEELKLFQASSKIGLAHGLGFDAPLSAPLMNSYKIHTTPKKVRENRSEKITFYPLEYITSDATSTSLRQSSPVDESEQGSQSPFQSVSRLLKFQTHHVRQRVDRVRKTEVFLPVWHGRLHHPANIPTRY